MLLQETTAPSLKQWTLTLHASRFMPELTLQLSGQFHHVQLDKMPTALNIMCSNAGYIRKS